MDASRRQGRAIPSPYPDVDEDGDVAEARLQPVQEGCGLEADRAPQPAGFGTEASTATQSFSVVDEYQVDPNGVAHVREIALSVESNGEVLANVAGVQYGPYTGSLDISIPLDPGLLTGGGRIVVKHQSTDGTSTTTRAQAAVLEV